MALNQQEILDLIESKLPDSSKIPIVDLREVLSTMVTDIIVIVSGGSSLTKDGYDWKKKSGNSNLSEYQLGDTIEGVGDFWANYYIKGYIKTVPMVDPETDIIILQSEYVG